MKTLLNAIADEKILGVLSHLIEDAPLFHNTQYFFEPASHTRAGDWHRDQQFGAPDEDTEKIRMAATVGIHVHIAFLPDENLEYIPGSHNLWDTPPESALRKGLYGRSRNSPDMPDAKRIRLQPGDAVFFSAWGIHRGHYVAGVPRRTFDVIYGDAPAWSTPPPTCFLQPGILDDLSPHAQRVFGKFIETYKTKWKSGDYGFSQK